jgi:hypothetical protein
MSHHELREEKTCLNCGNNVEQRFCGNCGQENIEPRQTFGHLIAHFFEDLTHYEGKFWETLRYLFFRPAFLTKEFIAGRRNRFLPPVRLYIFASFITFLLPALIPEVPSKEEDKHKPVKETADSSLTHQMSHKDSATLAGLTPVKDNSVKEEGDSTIINYSFESNDKGGISYHGAHKTMTALDSAKQARINTDDPMGYWAYRFNKKLIHLRKYPVEDQYEMIVHALGSNFPKALFVYMPLFAFILRLFHRKRNWIYFDHGIFTLHLFSFTLLAFLALLIVTGVFDMLVYFTGIEAFDLVSRVLMVAVGIWVPYYLFRAHHKMYEEKRSVSMLKVWGIIFLNAILFLAVMVAFVLVTFLTMH